MYENKGGEVVVENLTNPPVKNTQELERFLNQGERARQTTATRMNAMSSRSHTVFRIQVHIDDRNVQTGRHHIRSSQIQIVDLAGSEGASKIKSTGMTLREGSNINKSLLALSNVINRLA